MATGGDEAARMRVAPSTDPDGLGLTLDEFGAMSVEERRSVFIVDSLAAVHVVGPGHLERAPRDCTWYVRLRRAPENPGPKDAKQDSFQLVVKRPKDKAKEAEPKACDPGDDNPDRISLTAKDADGARLEALIFLARKAGRRRRAATWKIERVESLLVRDVIQKYIDVCLAVPPAGVQETERQKNRRKTYLGKLRAFQAAFPEKEIGDVNNSTPAEYDTRAAHRSPTTRPADLSIGKLAINEGLRLLGVPRNYSVEFTVKEAAPLPKVGWTPAEYDRVCAAADGWRFNADKSPKMVLGPNGLVQARRPARSIADREAWRRAVEFLPYSASRGGRLTPTRWVPPNVEPADGKPLPDRPWIEVVDPTLIIYHRDGDTNADKQHTKHCGSMIIPDEFAPTVYGWFEADVDAGIEFVFHKPDGARYGGAHLDRLTFKRILEDAAIDERRVPHHFKDLCVEWADSAGLDRGTLAVHADTTPETLASKYGDAKKVAQLMEAAQGLTQSGWREKGARAAQVLDRLKAGRARQASGLASGNVVPLQPAGRGRQPGRTSLRPAPKATGRPSA